MALPLRILVHTAVPLTYEEPRTVPDTWLEGEPGDEGGGEPVQGLPFACVLFLPQGSGEQPNAYRPRVVQSPTLLFNPTRDDQSEVVLEKEAELLVSAPELAQWTGGETVRWQLVGVATPFGPPGSVIGVMATLRQVQD